MDLNYLFYRQQVERSRSNSADCERARKAHEGLAIEYERKIGRVIGNRGLKAELPSQSDGSDVNTTMAVAITAKSVSQG